MSCFVPNCAYQIHLCHRPCRYDGISVCVLKCRATSVECQASSIQHPASISACASSIERQIIYCVKRRAPSVELLFTVSATQHFIGQMDSKLSVSGTDASVDDDIGVDCGSFRCFRGTYSYYQTLLRRIVYCVEAPNRRKYLPRRIIEIVEVFTRSSKLSTASN